MPVSNRLCMDRYYTRTLALHHEKLESMKPTPKRCQSVDNSQPESMSFTHLRVNLKKQQMEKERIEQLEKENRTLLDKLIKIQTRDQRSLACPMGGKHTEPFPYRTAMQLKPGYRIDSGQYPVVDCADRNLPRKSLNAVSRQRELDSIRASNDKMLHRLQMQAPNYSSRQMAAEFQQNQKYLKNIRNMEIANITYNLKQRSWTPMSTPRWMAAEQLTKRPWTSLPDITQKDKGSAL